jgi:hypothetical protein
MEDTQLLNIWKSYDNRLQENLLLNKANAAQITQLKMKSLLVSMKPLKIVTIVIGLAWVCFVDYWIVKLFLVASPFFLVSAMMQVLLTKLAIGIYLYQLILIHHADVSEPILKIQEKLARLKSSTLWVARVLFLQLPVWTTFYLHKGLLENGNVWLLALQGVVTCALTVLAVWLFLNIRYENRDKKWFQFLFAGPEWTPIIKSMEFAKELEDFKNESD